jgi:hypothetical protein
MCRTFEHLFLLSLELVTDVHRQVSKGVLRALCQSLGVFLKVIKKQTEHYILGIGIDLAEDRDNWQIFV